MFGTVELLKYNELTVEFNKELVTLETFFAA